MTRWEVDKAKWGWGKKSTSRFRLYISYFTKYCLVRKGSGGRDPLKIRVVKRTIYVVSLDWKRSVSDFSIRYAIVGRGGLNWEIWQLQKIFCNITEIKFKWPKCIGGGGEIPDCGPQSGCGRQFCSGSGWFGSVHLFRVQVLFVLVGGNIRWLAQTNAEKEGFQNGLSVSAYLKAVYWNSVM